MRLSAFSILIALPHPLQLALGDLIACSFHTMVLRDVHFAFFVSAFLDVIARENKVFKQCVEFSALFTDATCRSRNGIFIASLLESQFESVRHSLGLGVDLSVSNASWNAVDE